MQGAMSNYFSHNDEYNAPFEFLSANVSYQNPNFQFIPVMLYNCPAFDQQINFPSSILTISPYFLTGDVCFNNGGNDFIFPQTFYQAYDTFNFAYNYKHLDSFNVPVVFPTNYYGNTNGCFGLLNSNLIYNQNIDFSSMNINSIYYQYYDYMTGGPVDDTYSDLSVPADTISMLNFAEGLNYTMLNGFDDISYGGRTYSCSISPVFNSVIDFGTISDFTYNNTEPFTYEGSV
jgi:hypothetical protein